MALPRILVLGSDLAEELRPIRAALKDWPDSHVTRIAEAGRIDALTEFPDIVIVCQRHPDQFAAADVRQLMTRFPLARLICAYGAWCEGDGRTRDIWPLAVRVPAVAFPTWWDHELRTVGGHERTLPLTASRTEVFDAFSSAGLSLQVASRETVAVLSPDRAWREMLGAALRQAGATVVPAARDARRIVWDKDPDCDVRQQQREQLGAGLRGEQSIIDAVGLAHTARNEPSFWKLSPLRTIVRKVMEPGQ